MVPSSTSPKDKQNASHPRSLVGPDGLKDTSQTWTPKISVAEADKIMTGPGMMHELEEAVIQGRRMRVYKNLPPNLRELWIAVAQEWCDREYVIFENERLTYGQIRAWASRLAEILYTERGVRKGDRVAIIMRNFPEFVVTFWATHLIGAVATMINAWAPPEPLLYCIKSTSPKVIVVDSERADRLASARILDELKAKLGLKAVYVVRPYEPSPLAKVKSSSNAKWRWRGMEEFPPLPQSSYSSSVLWSALPACTPEDDATIFFTSGTTGLPKGVLSSQRGFLTNLFNMGVGRNRALLRNGEELPPPPTKDDPPKVVLCSVPLFHVTGCTSTLTAVTATGAKIVFMRKWDKDEAAKIIVSEKVTNAGGVPSMIMDLLETSLKSDTLENLGCGGAPSAETMPSDVQKRFKNVETAQGYGLSETNAIAASIHGLDFLLRPTSAGPATPVTDFLIVDPSTGKPVPTGHLGELWIRGPSVMKGYWNDPVATKKAITPEGWFKSGDIGLLDEDGFLFIKDRVKDIIIRGGENIHCVEVENALYADHRLFDAAVVSVPDKRLGELVAAIVATKPGFKGLVSEESVLEIARKHLPSHAVPVMVIVQDEMIERNANGKIVKDLVRKRVRKEWSLRLKQGAGKKSKAKL